MRRDSSLKLNPYNASPFDKRLLRCQPKCLFWLTQNLLLLPHRLTITIHGRTLQAGLQDVLVPVAHAPLPSRTPSFTMALNIRTQLRQRFR